MKKINLLFVSFFLFGSMSVLPMNSKKRKRDEDTSLNKRIKLNEYDANKELLQAVQKGDVVLATQALDKGADVDTTDQENCDVTPLLIATEFDQHDMVKLLITRGANVNKSDSLDNTPFMNALISGNMQSVALLMEHRAVEKYENIAGSIYELISDKTNSDLLNLQLIFALKRGYLEKVNQLLQLGADISPVLKSSYFQTIKHSLLLSAVTRGDLDLAKNLLANGAIPFIKVIEAAVLQKSPEYLKILFEKIKQDKELRGINIVSLKYTCHEIIKLDKSEHLAIFDAFISSAYPTEEYKKTGFWCLIVLHNSLNCAKWLLDNGTDVNFCDKSHNSLLHIAVNFQNIDMLRLLLERKADVNCANNEGDTPLHHAVIKGNVEIVRLLLDNSARVDVQNNLGYTPLFYIALQKNIQMSHMQIAKMLLDKKPDLSLVRCIKGPNPMHLVAQYAKFNLIRLFLWYAPNKLYYDFFKKVPGISNEVLEIFRRYQEKDFTTILFVACICGFDDILSQCLEKSPHIINRCNIYNNSLLHIAARYSQLSCMQVLLKYKINIDLQNQQGLTALHYAVLTGDALCIKALLDAGADQTIKTAQDNGLTAYDLCKKIDIQQFYMADIVDSMFDNSHVINGDDFDVISDSSNNIRMLFDQHKENKNQVPLPIKKRYR